VRVVIVNQQVGVDRRTLRRFRAFLFQLEKDGPEGKRCSAPGISDHRDAAKDT
jgi:hypothetical protein